MSARIVFPSRTTPLLPSLATFALFALGCAGNDGVSAKFPEIPPERAASVEVETDDQLSPAAIQAVLNEAHDSLRACYEAGLARNPELEGRVTVHFVIEHSGKVKSADLVEEGSGTGPATDLADREVLDCVLGAYRGLSFPAFSSGEMTVVYPMGFRPGEGGVRGMPPSGIEAAMKEAMPNQDQVARELVDIHFQVEPFLQEVWRFLSNDEGCPTEPIKLIEVNLATVATGRVTPFAFAPSRDVRFPVTIAEITPEELEAAKEDPGLLPPGWQFENAVRLTRREPS